MKELLGIDTGPFFPRPLEEELNTALMLRELENEANRLPFTNADVREVIHEVLTSRGIR